MGQSVCTYVVGQSLISTTHYKHNLKVMFVFETPALAYTTEV